MRYLVIERFRHGPIPVYARFRDRGRMAPDGLAYVSSWITHDGMTCYQVMECADRGVLDQWMGAWSDLVDFEVLPVMTSAEAAQRFTPSPGAAAGLDRGERA